MGLRRSQQDSVRLSRTLRPAVPHALVTTHLQAVQRGGGAAEESSGRGLQVRVGQGLLTPGCVPCGSCWCRVLSTDLPSTLPICLSLVEKTFDDKDQQCQTRCGNCKPLLSAVGCSQHSLTGTQMHAYSLCLPLILLCQSQPTQDPHLILRNCYGSCCGLLSAPSGMQHSL